jgi:hypothetical protein
VIRNPMPILLAADAPRVMTVPMLAAVLSSGSTPPARRTLFKWLREQQKSQVLRPVTRGLYLNQLARPRPEVAEAAGHVRAGAIVSLQTVLGDAGVSNNYSDIVTCVVPIKAGIAPSSRPVRAERIEFRFHAMPARLLNEEAGLMEDQLDLNVHYARATAEKALLDWIYLGASPRTKISGPPLDLALDRLSLPRLKRLANAMDLRAALDGYLSRKEIFDRDPDVQANNAVQSV